MKKLLPDLPRQAWIVLGGDLLLCARERSHPPVPHRLSPPRARDRSRARRAGRGDDRDRRARGQSDRRVLVDRIGARKTLLVGLLVASVGTTADRVRRHGLGGDRRDRDARSGNGPDLAGSRLAPRGRRATRAALECLLGSARDDEHRLRDRALVAAAVVSFESTSSFQLLYLLDAASFLLFAPLLLFALRGVGDRPEPDHEGRPARYRIVLRDRIFLRIVVLTALICGAGYAQMATAFPAFATDEGGISAAALGLVFAVNTVAVSVLQLPALKLAQGVGARPAHSRVHPLRRCVDGDARGR